MGNESGGVSSLFSDHTTATADVASSMSAMMKLLLRIDAGAAFMLLEMVMPFFDLRRGAVAAGAKRPRVQTFAYHSFLGCFVGVALTDMAAHMPDLRVLSCIASIVIFKSRLLRRSCSHWSRRRVGVAKLGSDYLYGCEISILARIEYWAGIILREMLQT